MSLRGENNHTEAFARHLHDRLSSLEKRAAQLENTSKWISSTNQNQTTATSNNCQNNQLSKQSTSDSDTSYFDIEQVQSPASPIDESVEPDFTKSKINSNQQPPPIQNHNGTNYDIPLKPPPIRSESSCSFASTFESTYEETPENSDSDYYDLESTLCDQNCTCEICINFTDQVTESNLESAAANSEANKISPKSSVDEVDSFDAPNELMSRIFLGNEYKKFTHEKLEGHSNNFNSENPNPGNGLETENAEDESSNCYEYNGNLSKILNNHTENQPNHSAIFEGMVNGFGNKVELEDYNKPSEQDENNEEQPVEEAIKENGFDNHVGITSLENQKINEIKELTLVIDPADNQSDLSSNEAEIIQDSITGCECELLNKVIKENKKLFENFRQYSFNEPNPEENSPETSLCENCAQSSTQIEENVHLDITTENGKTDLEINLGNTAECSSDIVSEQLTEKLHIDTETVESNEVTIFEDLVEIENKEDIQEEFDDLNNSSESNEICETTETASPNNLSVVSYSSYSKSGELSDNEEDDTKIPRIKRSSSLKTGKTPPGTPGGHKKIVRFADVLGLELSDVRTFLDEIPKIPKSAYSDLTYDRNAAFATDPAEVVVRSNKVLVPLFKQPGGEIDFFDRLRMGQCCLENACLQDVVSLSVGGIIRVRNLDFNKTVHVRYTFDNWKTFSDLQATYVQNSCDGFSDKFTFILYCHTLKVGEVVQFAVRFQCRGDQFWDNNQGVNYKFECVPSSEASTKTATGLAATLSLPGPEDNWITGFY